MKLNKKSSKAVSLILMFCLAVAALVGCGKGQETTEESLKEYVVEGVGTFYLPEGFEVESGTSDEVLPMSYAAFAKDSITVVCSRFGTDAYEAAGVPLPEDLEEYSQRDGVKQGLPDGAEFSKDSYGNLYVKYTLDGMTYYNALKMGEASFGSVAVIYPEGEDYEEDSALWLSKVVLE